MSKKGKKWGRASKHAKRVYKANQKRIQKMAQLSFTQEHIINLLDDPKVKKAAKAYHKALRRASRT